MGYPTGNNTDQKLNHYEKSKTNLITRALSLIINFRIYLTEASDTASNIQPLKKFLSRFSS